MKTATNFVLTSATSSTYPWGYACGVAIGCGLVGWPFWSAYWNSISLSHVEAHNFTHQCGGL